jgi:hypothetical protein
MAKQTIGIGVSAGDGTGDNARVAGGKINSNFTELYTNQTDILARLDALDGQVSDILAPAFVSAVIENATPTIMRVTMDEALSGALPAFGVFGSTVATVARAFNQITSIDSTHYDLTLVSAVTNGQAVTLSYTKGANPLKDAADNETPSTSTPITVTNNVGVAATVPGAPTIGTAVQTGSTTANVPFTAPGSNGGATITSYIATSSPGSITGTLTQAGSGTIAITGLTASTAYTFTVKAVNSVGQSAASAASNSITTAAGGGALLLDAVGATVLCAFSMQRKLRSAATQAFMIQRVSDSTVLDVGFTGNATDQAAADTFISATTGIVPTLYDQSAAGNNVSASVLGNRPAYVSSGFLTKPYIRFDGINDVMVSAALTVGPTWTGLAVVQRYGFSVTEPQGIFGADDNTTRVFQMRMDAGVLTVIGISTPSAGQTATVAGTVTNMAMMGGQNDGSNVVAYYNSTVGTAVPVVGTANSGSVVITIGRSFPTGAADFAQIQLVEFIIWGPSLTAPQLAIAKANVLTAFGL